jgi:peroxiredoxin
MEIVLCPAPAGRSVLACRTVAVIMVLTASWRASAAAPPMAQPLERIALRDTSGQTHTPAEWQTSKAVVLFFLGTECPVSNYYASAMKGVAAKYAQRGVTCLGIHADPSVSAEDAAVHAKEYGLSFPIWMDPEQQLAAAVGARVTPDAFVLSPDGRVLYRGRIDDRFALDGKRRDVPTTRDLVDAIEAVLAGKAPPVSETKAYGCPLPKPKKPPG